MEEKLATVDLISETWSAKGAAGDALQRVGHADPFLAIWESSGDVRYSTANLDWKSLALLHSALGELLSRYAGQWLES